MQSLQKNQGQGGLLWQIVWLICGGLLAGCVTPHPRLVSPPLPTAARRSALSFPATVPPPLKEILIVWLNGNTGDTNVITGLQSTTDFVTWQTICTTNCDEATNYYSVPLADRGFIRAFNDWKQ